MSSDIQNTSAADFAPTPVFGPRKAAFRALPNGSLPTLLVALAAGLGFFFLRHGSILAGPGAMAYSESIHHAVAPAADGKLVELRVDVGQHVKAGDVLAVMDGRALVLARERALAQEAVLEAQVLAALQVQDSAVTRSELWVLKARASEKGERAGLDELTQQLERMDALLAHQMIPASEAESTREKHRTLAARVEAYDQAIGRGQAGYDKSGNALANHRATVAAQTEPARKAVDVQRTAIKQLDLAIEELTLRAPVDAVVTTLSHRPGEIIQAGTEIASLVTARPGIVVAIVPEHAVHRVTVGAVAELRREKLFARALEGRVLELAPEVEEVPLRARPSPSISAWGRRAVIELPQGSELLPGEGFHVTFR